MLDEIYVWLDSYAGVSFDFDESMQEIGGNIPVIEPFTWHSTILIVFEHLDSACDTIDEYWQAIPDYLPSKNKMKRTLTEHTLELIVTNVRNTCNMLNIDIPEMKTMDVLKRVIETLYDLLDMLTFYTIDDIQKSAFDDYEESNNEAFSNILDLQKEDMIQLSQTVHAIRESYYDSFDIDDDNL
jgi:hypothetical protein